MGTETIFNITCAAAAVIMLVYYMRRRRKLLSFAFGSVTGIIALFLVNSYGYIVGAELPLNLFNVCGSAVLGVPFVICVTVLKLL
jgi:pro-sigmaK processing inhibitor BofA